MEGDWFVSHAVDDVDDFVHDQNVEDEEAIEVDCGDKLQEQEDYVRPAKKQKPQPTRDLFPPPPPYFDLSKDAFYKIVCSWSTKSLILADDEMSRNLCWTNIGPRPDRFDRFSSYCLFWFKFAAEEARTVLRNRILCLHDRKPTDWKNRFLHVRIKSIEYCKKSRKSYVDCVFTILNQTFHEHFYQWTVYLIGPFCGGNHGHETRGDIESMVLGVVCRQTTKMTEIFVRIHSLQLDKLTKTEGDIVGTMFALRPLENLVTTYRSALACCEALQPGFSSRLLGHELPRHSRFSTLDGEGSAVIDFTACPTNEPLVHPKESLQLNPSQSTALRAIISDVEEKSSSLNLVQGPPGTGKTHFVAKLIHQLAATFSRVIVEPVPAAAVLPKKKRKLKQVGVKGAVLGSQGQPLKHSGDGREPILATGPSNKAVVVMLEKFIAFGGCQHSRVILFGVEEKLGDCSSGDISADTDILSVVINQPPGTAHNFAQLYEVVTNPRCIAHLLARQIPELFARALVQLRVFISEFRNHIILNGALCNKDLAVVRFIYEEFKCSTKLLDWMLPESVLGVTQSGMLKTVRKESWTHQKAVATALESLVCFVSVDEPHVSGKDDAAVLFACTDLIQDTLASALNFLDVFCQRVSSKDMQDDLTSSLLGEADIIFATLSSLGNAALRRSVTKCSVVVCDEAAQASEASTLIPLVFRPRHFILVGDPAQLPAYVDSAHASRMQCEESLMRRLMQGCQASYFMLDTQYRMHKEIVSFPNDMFYDGRLSTHHSVLSRRFGEEVRAIPPRVRWLGLPFAFLSTDAGVNEHGGRGHSFCNLDEAKLVISLLEQLQIYHFGNHHEPLSRKVVVITFYSAQVELLKQLLRNRHDDLSGVRVVTVDSVQGSESDIVILSFVRSNDSGSTGFLKNPNRLNVALTRAKHQLLCVGSASTIANLDKFEDGAALSQLVSDAKRRGLFISSEELSSQSLTTGVL